MIRGLTWANVRWLCLFFLILVMTATADGYLKLNYSFVTAAIDTIKSGGQGFLKWQGEAAKSLDEATRERYGYDPFDKRISTCATSPNKDANLPTDISQKLAQTKPVDRASLVKTIGEPFCKQVSGHEIWLVGGNQTLQAEYNPLRYRIIKAKP